MQILRFLTSVSAEKRPWRFEDALLAGKRGHVERRTEFRRLRII